MTTSTEQLREEWEIESRNVGANIPSYVSDWWLSKYDSILAEKRSEIIEASFDDSNDSNNYGKLVILEKVLSILSE